MIVNINFACNKPQNMLANDDGFPEILSYLTYDLWVIIRIPNSILLSLLIKNHIQLP